MDSNPKNYRMSFDRDSNSSDYRTSFGRDSNPKDDRTSLGRDSNSSDYRTSLGRDSSHNYPLSSKTQTLLDEIANGKIPKRKTIPYQYLETYHGVLVSMSETTGIDFFVFKKRYKRAFLFLFDAKANLYSRFRKGIVVPFGTLSTYYSEHCVFVHKDHVELGIVAKCVLLTSKELENYREELKTILKSILCNAYGESVLPQLLVVVRKNTRSKNYYFDFGLEAGKRDLLKKHVENAY
jgi:hypothetical protein